MKRLLLFFVMCLLLASMVSAQDDYDSFIAYGESNLGALTDDDPTFTMAFDGAVGDVIYIAAIDNEVAFDFKLFSPTGGQLSQSDNMLIKNLELGVAGVYTIEFTRADWSDSEGEFIAHLGHYSIDTLNVEDDGWTLTNEGYLDDAGAQQQFEVDFAEGELITTILYSANSVITMQSPTGEFLLFEGGYDDPVIPLYRIPMDGTYIITVQTIELGGSEYELYIFKHDPIVVTVNEPVFDELEEGLPAVLEFTSEAGKMWDINAIVPQNGEGSIALFQFDGRDYWATQIESDWGSGPDGQPRIQPFIPSVSDTYYIALWYDDYGTNDAVYDYELVVSPSTLLSIVNDTPLTGEISSDTGEAQFGYRGNAGDKIRINYRKLSKDGGLGINMYSVEDEVITFTGRNASSGSFEVELPLDGFYEFVVWNPSYDDESVLQYEILIELLPK